MVNTFKFTGLRCPRSINQRFKKQALMYPATSCRLGQKILDFRPKTKWTIRECPKILDLSFQIVLFVWKCSSATYVTQFLFMKRSIGQRNPCVNAGNVTIDWVIHFLARKSSFTDNLLRFIILGRIFKCFLAFVDLDRRLYFSQLMICKIYYSISCTSSLY